MGRSALRQCPYCGQPWPSTPKHALRGFAWLDPLPRNISPSNGDLFIHDGAHGRDRFLFVEAKTGHEPPTRSGQNWLLAALGRQADWTVRLIRGNLERLTFHQVGRSGADPEGHTTTAGEFRRSVVDWINGVPWRDPARASGSSFLPGIAGHTHGYARGADGVWRCVQDYYAPGDSSETGCGETWEAA